MRNENGRHSYGLSDLKGDVFGGLVSAVMMVPVALGFGVLSGLGPVAAFYGAIAVGLFTAVLGGAAPMISGPSAIVTIFTAVIIGTYADSMAEAFTIVMMAGLMQIVFGALRLGRFINWLPFSVVRGVFVGVGGYIFMTQTLWFVGAPVEPGIGVVAIIASWPRALANLNVDAFAVATVSLLVFMLWPAKLHRVVPNALVALIVATLAGALLFDGAARIGEPEIGIPALQAPVLTTAVLVDAIQPALILAFLSSIYNLLTALIIDPDRGAQPQAEPGAVRPGGGQHRGRPDRRAARCGVGALFAAGREIRWAYAGDRCRVRGGSCSPCCSASATRWPGFPTPRSPAS